MEFKLYICSRYGKYIKFTNDFKKYINICKILITLPSFQSFILASILEYNTTNYLDLPSDNIKKNISLRILNNDKKKIRLADITSNNNKNSKHVDID